MTVIPVPYNWSPREYQLPIWNYMENGGKRAVAVWHRRAGKDLFSINWTCFSAFRRPGLYWHILPTYQQGRKVVWEGMDFTGRRFIDYFPEELVTRKRDDYMRIELANGSMWQVVGGDNPDSLVGPNPVGVVFSEYALQDPKCWDLIRPILAENGGWAIFIYTPRGHNHGYDLYNMAKHNPAWFCELCTVDDTFVEEGVPVITHEQIEEEIAGGMDPELAQQEFFCSFEAPMSGSYYGKQMQLLEEEGHIGNHVVTEPDIRVDTVWDLGMDDSTAIWFYQIVGREVHLIDYAEGTGDGMDDYVKLVRARDYHYHKHWAPWDIKVRELGPGMSRLEQARRLGIRFGVVPNMGLQDGINATRAMLPRCWFNLERCERGISCLRGYRREYNSKTGIWSVNPYKDWTNHGADSFRYLAVLLSGKILTLGRVDKPGKYDLTFSEWCEWSEKREDMRDIERTERIY